MERAIDTVQDSSHTPQGAFGYLLGQIDPRPRLSVATHFPVSDDTVDCAMRSVRNHVPDIGNLEEQLTFSFDGMVISAFAGSGKVTQRRAEVLDFGSLPVPQIYGAYSRAEIPLRERAPGSLCPDRPDTGDPGRRADVLP